MRELRQKQQLKRALYSIPSLAILAVLAFLLARGAGNIFAKERESARVLDALREKNAVLREREEALKDNIARLSTEEGIVEEIRSKFNVARPGERLAIVVEEKPAEAPTSTPWYRKIWDAIIKRKE